MPGGIHHCVVVVHDLEASLRFYRDGLGLDLLHDRQVEGDRRPAAPCARSSLATLESRTTTPVS
jgi:catechol 2,3-dioxygenase-like lactoylglutathione lyase family enzyme